MELDTVFAVVRASTFVIIAGLTLFVQTILAYKVVCSGYFFVLLAKNTFFHRCHLFALVTFEFAEFHVVQTALSTQVL